MVRIWIIEKVNRLGGASHGFLDQTGDWMKAGIPQAFTSQAQAEVSAAKMSDAWAAMGFPWVAVPRELMPREEGVPPLPGEGAA